MKHDLKSVIVGILSSLGIVVFAALAGAAVGHADGPSRADYANLNAIKANQKVIAKDRDAYNAFVKAKSDNAAKVAAVNADGWNVDWSTIKLIPAAPSFQ